MSMKGQGHSLTLAKGHSDLKIRKILSETVDSFEAKVQENGNESFRLSLWDNLLRSWLAGSSTGHFLI